MNEDPILSRSVSLDITWFLSIFNVVGVEELALGANMPVEALNERLKWNGSPSVDDEPKMLKNDWDFIYEFKPRVLSNYK